MANTWYTNIQDFLDLDGLPPVDLPHAGELLLDYFGSIIEAVTTRDERSTTKTTDIECRRRPRHRRCSGRIIAAIDEGDPDTIRWICPACSDNGFISGWQESIWDERQAPHNKRLHRIADKPGSR